MSPQMKRLLPHAAVRTTSDNDRFSNSSAGLRFGHDFSQVVARPLAPIVSQDYSNVSSSPQIQAKLKIGQPGDKCEQEADRVAEQVMRMPDPRLSSSVSNSSLASSGNSSSGTIQRVCAPCLAEYKAAEDENRFVELANLCPKCRAEDGLIQTKQITPIIQQLGSSAEGEEWVQMKTMGHGMPEVTSDISTNIRSLQGGGRPMSDSERGFFEPRFGADFSGVRVHDDARAADVARSVNARAFTLGKDVVFGAGEYSPDSSSGRKLFAHELVHVRQQNHTQRSLTPFVQRSLTPFVVQRQLITPQAAGGEAALVSDEKPDCTAGPGIPNSSCSGYVRNIWWLPVAYVNNATCACVETPNTSTAKCVRKFLQDRLAATPMLLKMAAAAQKVHEISNPSIYQAFVQIALTPRIYQDHVDAYAACCCPSGPADYPAWVGVTSVPLPCFGVGMAIRHFGSCHGTPGAW